MEGARDAPLSPAWVAGAAALFIFFWSSGFVAAKYGFPYAEPFTFLAIRFVIGSVALLAICRLWHAEWPSDMRGYGHIIAAGLMVQSFYLVGVYYGIYLGVSTGIVALVVGLQPLLTGALAGSFLGERVSTRQWLGLTLGFVGLGMVVAERVTLAGAPLAGFAIAAFGLVSITVGTLYQKKYCAAFDIRSTVAVQNLASCVVMFALAASFETMRVTWTGEFLFALLWSAFGLSVIAITLYYWLVRRGAAAKVTSLIYLSPPTTALMGWAAFDETLGWIAVGGMAVAIAGVALATGRK
jgi:drug/metabolite transporter (DMT)-like permease